MILLCAPSADTLLKIFKSSALGAADSQRADYVDARPKKINVPTEDLPRCCSEAHWHALKWCVLATSRTNWTDIHGLLRHACLVIGTSSTVRADDWNFLSVINLLSGKVRPAICI